MELIELNKKKFEDNFQIKDRKVEFLNNYFPQLLNKNDNKKYFWKFEFKDKQGFWEPFWKKAVEKLYKVLIRGFSVKEKDIIEIFSIDGIKPLPLVQIIKILKNSNLYLEIINLDKEIDKLLNLVTSPEAHNIFNIIKSIFKNKNTDKENNMNDNLNEFNQKLNMGNNNKNPYLICINNFKIYYENSKIKYTRIFEFDNIFEEKIFFDKFEEICHWNRSDTIILIRCFLKLKLLYRKKELIRNKIYIFYSIISPENDQFKKDLIIFKFKNEINTMNYNKKIILNKKSVVLEKIKLKMEEIKSSKTEKEVEHLKKIIKIYLAHKNKLNLKIEEIDKKIIFFESQEIKMKDDNDTNFLKELNKMIEKYKDNQIDFNDNLIDIEENLKEIENNGKMVDEYYNENNLNDEDLLKEFEKEIEAEDKLIEENKKKEENNENFSLLLNNN